MKLYRVIGFRKYSGDYEGRPYSGYYVHAECLDEPSPGFEGHMVTNSLKIKTKVGYVPCVGDQIGVSFGENGIEEVEKIF